jgi:adhesin/invasin
MQTWTIALALGTLLAGCGNGTRHDMRDMHDLNGPIAPDLASGGDDMGGDLAGTSGDIASAASSDIASPPSTDLAVLAAVDVHRSLVSVSPTTPITADGTSLVSVNVTLRDSTGTSLHGYSLQAVATGHGNTIDPPTTTDSAGEAVFKLTSTVAELKTITVQVLVGGSMVTLSQQPSITFVAGPPAKLDFTAQPSQVAVTQPITPEVQVTVRDANGNVVDSGGNVTLTGPHLQGDTTEPTSHGIATFTSLHVDTIASAEQLTAHLQTLTATSNTFAVTPEAPTQLVFLTQPATSVSADDTVSVQVALQDANGDVITNGSGSVSLALDGSDTATLTGNSPVTLQNGVASFTALNVDKVGWHRLVASLTGYTSGKSQSFSVTAGFASTLTVTPSQKVQATGGDLIRFVVTVRDDKGNPARLDTGFSEGTVSVEATGSGNDFFDGSSCALRDGSCFVYLSSTVAENKTVTVTGADFSRVPLVVLTNKTEVRFYDPLVATSNPGVVGQPITLTATLLDNDGNPISNHAITFSAADPAITVGTPSTKTGTNGQAQTTVLTTKAGTYHVSDHDTKDRSLDVTFQPDHAVSVIVTPPTLQAPVGTTARLEVDVLDQFGNGVPGIVLTLQADSGLIPFPNTGTTNDGGIAVTHLTSNQLGPVKLTATDQFGDVGKGIVTFTVGAPDPSTTSVVAAPLSVPADGTSTSTITVTAADVDGNRIPSQPVSLTLVGQGGKLTPQSGTTDPTGVFVAQLSATSVGDIKVVATIGSVTLTQTVSFTTP